MSPLKESSCRSHKAAERQCPSKSPSQLVDCITILHLPEVQAEKSWRDLALRDLGLKSQPTTQENAGQTDSWPSSRTQLCPHPWAVWLTKQP